MFNEDVATTDGLEIPSASMRPTVGRYGKTAIVAGIVAGIIQALAPLLK